MLRNLYLLKIRQLFQPLKLSKYKLSLLISSIEEKFLWTNDAKNQQILLLLYAEINLHHFFNQRFFASTKECIAFICWDKLISFFQPTIFQVHCF